MNDTLLERLYDTYAGGVFHYFVSLSGGEADAKDLLQELFIKIARLKWSEPTDEKAWLWRVAHNLAMDWRRRNVTRQGYEIKLGQHQLRLFDAGADPDLKSLAAALQKALKCLPEEQRSVLILKLWEGLTFEQIAEVQGIPLNTAASRYRYALDKLQTLLRPIYEELR